MNKIGICIIGLLMGNCYIEAQTLTLTDAIKIAQENSLDAQIARFSFMSKYWQYRSFKAELLPSVNLGGTLGNFNHSVVETRDFESGRVNQVNNNTMANFLTLSLDQKIAATGGTISLQSYLYRLDQFDYKEKNYNSQPLRISYTQGLRSFNSLKWEKKTAPVEYQIAERNYISAMQDVTIKVTSLFFNVLATQSDYKQSLATVEDRERLYEISKNRLNLTTTTKSEVLQMELSLLNARMAVKKNKITLDEAMYDLFSYLRLADYENADLLPPFTIPDILISTDDVLQKAINNSSHGLDQKLQILEAQKALAQAKANKGIQMTLSSEVGFSQTGNTFGAAYSHLMDNEIIGLSLSLPIFDWGVSKGKVKMAQAQLDMVKTQLEQSHLDYVQNLRKKVTQFNVQPTQCKDALRAQDIAVERYEITRKRYEAGAVSVTELNTAQQEMESAKAQYISQLSSFWNDYYTLQKATLYDWKNKKDLIVDFESLIK
ncbi:TolC family protein [Prevotella sp. FD3004]|uniref:TolC family protein n=1 Tax=Prevotella sp. FD3004 TaxID=1408309 RepID=UPI00055D82A8|nr:TolC family protein [Prevotella sp. FD3004]